MRNKEGMWDFGSNAQGQYHQYQLSNSWWNSKTRKIDHTTRVLILLRKKFDFSNVK